MYQQQELYRHQQEALARLQDEADRLRQETLVVINGDSFFVAPKRVLIELILC